MALVHNFGTIKQYKKVLLLFNLFSPLLIFFTPNVNKRRVENAYLSAFVSISFGSCMLIYILTFLFYFSSRFGIILAENQYDILYNSFLKDFLIIILFSHLIYISNLAIAIIYIRVYHKILFTYGINEKYTLLRLF